MSYKKIKEAPADDALAHRWPCPKQTSNGGRGCVTWREGCESGPKKEREVWEVAPRCAGRIGTKARGPECERGRKRSGNCILTVEGSTVHEYM